MEVSSQSGFKFDEEALKSLLDAFGSAFSLDQIASAYCKASRNADLAGEILFDMQRSSSDSTFSSSDTDAGVQVCEESSNGFSCENSLQGEYSRGLKPKTRPVSVGTVSSMLGKDYVRSQPSRNGSCCVTSKPLKLDANELPMSEIWDDTTRPNISKQDQLHKDMENFLCKMLGDGFQLDRDKIRGVLDSCGYDMQKSLDKLLDDPISNLDQKARVVGDSSGRSTDINLKSELPSSERRSHDVNHRKGNSSRVLNKGAGLHGQRKERDDLQKEVLTSLFHVREHSDESPKRIVKDVKKDSPYRRVVKEPPPEDSQEDLKIDMSYSQLENADGPEDENDYQNLRKAVKEYRATMKEYLRAAFDAGSEGDHVKEKKLLDQAQFFLTKAHEADEESSKMIVETRAGEEQEMLLDLHDHGSNEAISLLECHLSSLSGIPSINYLKVIIDADKDASKVSRRRKRIMKLLEKESIKWEEGETTGTILISLDKIDRKNLSFLKK